MRRKKWLKRAIWTLTIVFILMNIVAIFHAYKLTHFATASSPKTAIPTQLTTWQKTKALFFGISNPRPSNSNSPNVAFETIRLKSNKEIECWHLRVPTPRGTIAIFHGFGGEKSSMLDKAAIFNGLGYDAFLVDFMGSGGSEGNQTTIGFLEAEQVKTCFEYLQSLGEKRIFLFGTSMGAVAIMKLLQDYDIAPSGIIIECPFGTMYKTVSARFRLMKVPSFPMAGLLVFWGGTINGFWAFGHNPTTYAKSITTPTLLLYGAQDPKVSRQEIDEIFTNLQGEKQLKIYQNAGHENYLTKYSSEWQDDIADFLNKF
jgi:hypothetical protein